MSRTILLFGASVFSLCLSAFDACAQVAAPPSPTPAATTAIAAQARAPIGVFGVDMPAAGKFVFAFSPSFTRMQGSKIGTTSVSPEYIVSNVLSADTPVGCHLLRMVPDHLGVDGQGVSIAYGLTKDVTLFASTVVLEKSVVRKLSRG